MRKLAIGILGIVGLGVLGGIVFVVFMFIRGTKAPADLATRPWIEHKFYTDRLVLDVPWELKPNAAPPGKAVVDGRLDSCQRDGLEVVACVSMVSPEGDLDTAMDRMAETLRAKSGITVISESRKEESVIGNRAITLYLTVNERWGKKSNLRIFFFKYDNRLYQIHCNSRMGDATGDTVLGRIKKSVRPAKGAEASVEKITKGGTSGLPVGVKRR